MWTECTECIFFEDCDKRENGDGCYFGETEEELEKPKRGNRRKLPLLEDAFFINKT